MFIAQSSIRLRLAREAGKRRPYSNSLYSNSNATISSSTEAQSAKTYCSNLLQYLPLPLNPLLPATETLTKEVRLPIFNPPRIHPAPCSSRLLRHSSFQPRDRPHSRYCLNPPNRRASPSILAGQHQRRLRGPSAKTARLYTPRPCA